MNVKGTIGKTHSTHLHGAPIADVTMGKANAEDVTKAEDVIKGEGKRVPIANGEWVAVYLSGMESRAVPAILHLHQDDPSPESTQVDLDLAVRTVLLGPGEARKLENVGPVSVGEIVQTDRARWSREPRERPRWWLWLRRLIDRAMPTSAVLCQVTRGPLPLAEQNVAFLDKSAMQVLGLSPGDEVVLSSVSPLVTTESKDDFARIVKVVKVYEHSQERKDGHVPAIQLSEAMRSQLGLDSKYEYKMNASEQLTFPVPSLLVAPSRGYALTDNLRETALIVSLGAFGVAVSLSDSPPALRWSIALAGGVLIPLALIFWRVRTRLR